MPASCAKCEDFVRYGTTSDSMWVRCVRTMKKVYEGSWDDVRKGNLPYTNMRDTDCPLIPLPSEHGRLIDADKLLKDNGLVSHTWIDKAPTVVSAEGGK